ncbi:MAG: KH domain-containing protein [Aigarchaeota archaeon]|nr:KH domain-containing protein [Aigarchaeota archaeon]MDW8093034.1 KH domain-containing protein [Nitrososphaerota archaeon]
MSSPHGFFVVNVPPDRLPVLIGQNGEVKRRIEALLGVRIELKSDQTVAEVRLSRPVSEGGDPVALLKGRDVLTAIATGFSPERALRLAKENEVLSLIDLSEFLGRNPNNLARVKARIIGTSGRTRRIIEETTSTYISVYSDKVAIIGAPEDVKAADEAVRMLVRGSPHSAVYRFLDNYARRRKLSPKFY